MIKKLHISIVSILMIGLMFSCSTSNDVASNRGIQKRKYNKGFYVEKGPKMGGDTKKVELVENENTVEETPMTGDAPTERISSAPEVIFVEEVEETIAEVTPEVPTDDMAINVEVEEPPYFHKTAVEESQSNVVPEGKTKNRLMNRIEKVLNRNKATPQNMTRSSSESGIMLVLLVLLAIFLAPLAVLIYDGVDRPFWIDLILWLVGIGVGYFLFGAGVAFLCGLIATIYALLIIFNIV
ncbi:MAG: YqaE/Pmp3 family membrane protein [Crocinitomix sp.]|nr:YqaE/Pmp3 family membrane protein [Crocinitomix sp.]